MQPPPYKIAYRTLAWAVRSTGRGGAPTGPGRHAEMPPEHATPAAAGGDGEWAVRPGGGDGAHAARRVFLPRIPQAAPAAGKLQPARGCAASKVHKLLTGFRRLDSVEKRTREFYTPQAGAQIKGIFNCEAQMGAWDVRRRHRYADVLMADKPRDHELEVFNSLRERRREALLNGTVDRPSLLPLALLPEERTQLQRAKQGKKKQEEAPHAESARSQSCEPQLETACSAPILAQKSLKGTVSALLMAGSLAKTAAATHAAREEREKWLKRVDLNSGRYYYFNSLSGLSSWDPPACFPREHARYQQLQERRRREQGAQEEMLELRVLVEEHSELIESLRSVGKTDACVDALLGGPGQRPKARGLEPGAARAPAMKDLEDMASMTVQPEPASSEDVDGSGIRCSPRAHRTLSTQQEIANRSPQGSSMDVDSEAWALSWRVNFTGPDGEPGYLHVREAPTELSAEVGLKSFGDVVQAEGVIDTPDGGWLKLCPRDPHSANPQPGGYMWLNHGKFLVNLAAEAREQREADERARRESDALEEEEALKRARFFVVKAEDLPQLPHTQQLAALGAKLVVDGENGTVQRLCDLLNGSQAAILVQRNYRIRRSRMIIQRKYLAEDNWRFSCESVRAWACARDHMRMSTEHICERALTRSLARPRIRSAAGT